MTRRASNKGIAFSVCLHLLFFGVLGLMVAWQHYHRPEPPHILELVALPPAEIEMPEQAEPQAEPTPEEMFLQAPQITPVERVDIPRIEPLPPEPPPPPPPPPEPRPQPNPEPRPEPKPEPQPEQVSAAQFFQQHGRPTPRPPRQPERTPSPAPRIDTSRIAEDLRNMLSSQDTRSASRSAQDQADLLNYLQRLRRHIERAWVQPSLADQREWVEIEITVQRDGRLTGFRILRQEAGSALTQSIERAIRETRPIGPPPGNEPVTARFTFRLQHD